MFNFIKNLSTTEILVIALIVIVLFGTKFAKRVGKVSGETLKEVKKIKTNFSDAVEDSPKSDKKGVSK